MNPIDMIQIEQQARELRAQELRRIQGLFTQRLAVHVRLLGKSLMAGVDVIAEAVRPLFSWHPRPNSHI